MARLVMDGPHRAQIEEMLKDEKLWSEIIEFMKKTYDIKVKNHHIAYIKKTMDGGAPGKPAKGKRKYHRREGGIVKQPDSFAKGESVFSRMEVAGLGLSDDQLKTKIIAGIQEFSSRSHQMLLEIHAEVEKMKLNMAIATGLVAPGAKKGR